MNDPDPSDHETILRLIGEREEAERATDAMLTRAQSAERTVESLRALLLEALDTMEGNVLLAQKFRAALSAAPLTVAPPREPTPAMLRAGKEITREFTDFCFIDDELAAVYRAMVAAAPQGEATPPREDVDDYLGLYKPWDAAR